MVFDSSESTGMSGVSSRRPATMMRCEAMSAAVRGELSLLVSTAKLSAYTSRIAAPARRASVRLSCAMRSSALMGRAHFQSTCLVLRPEFSGEIFACNEEGCDGPPLRNVVARQQPVQLRQLPRYDF